MIYYKIDFFLFFFLRYLFGPGAGRGGGEIYVQTYSSMLFATCRFEDFFYMVRRTCLYLYGALCRGVNGCRGVKTQMLDET